MNDNKNRIDEIDIIKALGIICMVAGHAGAPFTHFVYLFHIAIFFTASGYFFKQNSTTNYQTIKTAAFRKMKQLWLPFVVWNSVYILLHNFFIKINVYTDNPEILNYVSGELIGTKQYYEFAEIVKRILKSFLFSNAEQMYGASWFLRILLMVSLCFLFTDFILGKLIKRQRILGHAAVSIVLLAIGYILSVRNQSLFGFAQTASYYILYFMGLIFSIYKEKFSKWNWKYYLPILVITFIVLLILNRFGSISLNENKYENPLFLVICSFSGWLFLYSSAYFIKYIPWLKRLMLIIGKRTLPIVILHFLSFKFVAAIAVKSYNLPSFCMAAYPNLYGKRGLWWLAYVIVGVSFPVIASIIYEKIVRKCKNELRKAKA